MLDKGRRHKNSTYKAVKSSKHLHLLRNRPKIHLLKNCQNIQAGLKENVFFFREVFPCDMVTYGFDFNNAYP